MKKCVVAIAKNEDRYIAEWLNHYKGLGFSKAVVFDNGSKPSLQAVVNRNGLSDFCIVDERFVGVTTFSQLKAYKIAFETYKGYFDWFGFFDIDEFLSVDGDVDAFLSNERYSKFDGIRLHWRIFTDSNLVRYDARPVRERFRTYLPIDFVENHECKMLLRSSAKPGSFSCHGARDVRLCDTAGVPCENYWEKNEGPVKWDHARVDHYRTKTIEEFMSCKYVRGDTWSKHSTSLHEFFRVNEKTPEKLAFIQEFTGSSVPLDIANDSKSSKFSVSDRRADVLRMAAEKTKSAPPENAPLHEKIRYLNLVDLSDSKIRCVDKITAKEYAKEKLGDRISVAKTLQVLGSGNDPSCVRNIDLDSLPNKFIIKRNDSWQKMLFCWNKSKFDKEKAVQHVAKWWMINNPGISSDEYQYSMIQPRIFVEELLTDRPEESLIDFRFWCFEGIPRFVAVNGDKGNGSQTFLDTSFKRINLFNKKHMPKPGSVFSIRKPENFDDMVEAARVLSKPFKFVRVDLYSINGKTYFGEMTFSPGAYKGRFVDSMGNSLDTKLGNLIKI